MVTTGADTKSTEMTYKDSKPNHELYQLKNMHDLKQNTNL